MHIPAYVITPRCMPYTATSIQCVIVDTHLVTPEFSSSEQAHGLPHSSQLDRGQHLSNFHPVRPAIHSTSSRWLDLNAERL